VTVRDEILGLGVVEDLTKPVARAVLPLLVAVGSLMAGGGGWVKVVGVGVAILAAGCQALASYVLNSRLKAVEGARARLAKENELSRALDILTNALDSGNDRPEPGRRFRANVMVPVRDSPAVLIMAYQTAGYDIDAHRIEWAAGQGCCGEAWQTNRPQTFPRPGWERRLLADPHEDRWSYPEGYVRQRDSARAKAIVSIPLHVPGRTDLRLGVLNIDDLGCEWDDARPWATMLAAGEKLQHTFEQLLYDIGYRAVSHEDAGGRPPLSH
jgi:hypothetical protein